MTSLSNNTGEYQGYPYRNPIVTDVQTIDSETASKWANLPRRTITEGRRETPKKVTNSRNETTRSDNLNLERTKEIETPPDIYIDIPLQPEVSNRRNDNLEDNSGFVEDTIFYDPFEDRRINIQQPDQRSQQITTPGSPPYPSIPRSSVPGSSRPDLSQASTTRLPLISKETLVYGARTPDDFPLSPIPVSEFPEPPPAYTEEYTPREREPPRTVVVVPDPQTPVGIASEERKLLSCAHCGLRVHTLAVRENGVVTHVLAIVFFFLFAPLTLLIYCTDCCKYRNHYCPNCNQLIGYEVPILCQDMVYNKPV